MIRPRDQPRACGTGVISLGWAGSETGSTPRVRDRSGLSICSSVRHRINPARAGQVGPASGVCVSEGDQPRACGTGSCIILRSRPDQRPAIFDSFTGESAASAHRYQGSRLQPKSATIFSTDTNHSRLKPIPAEAHTCGRMSPRFLLCWSASMEIGGTLDQPYTTRRCTISKHTTFEHRQLQDRHPSIRRRNPPRSLQTNPVRMGENQSCRPIRSELSPTMAASRRHRRHGVARLGRFSPRPRQGNPGRGSRRHERGTRDAPVPVRRP